MITTSSIAQLQNVSVNFGKTQALQNATLEIPAGKIIGLLGANGSGKSTLLRTLVGMYLPTTGTAQTLNRPTADLTSAELARIGYVHQEGELLDWMKASQLIRYVSTYYPTWNHNLESRYIKEFQIDLSARVGKLSPGQRQRLAILLAICHEPEFLILDEPAAALDPIARSHFLDLLLTFIQDSNRTIIISSHILSDIEKVIDHVVILHEGKIIRNCPFDELQEEFTSIHITTLAGDLPNESRFGKVVECKRNEKQAVLTIQNSSREQLEQTAADLNCQIEFRPLDLEQLYRLVMA